MLNKHRYMERNWIRRLLPMFIFKEKSWPKIASKGVVIKVTSIVWTNNAMMSKVICPTCRKQFQALSSLMTYHRVSRLTRLAPLVELLTLPVCFSGVRFTRSLVYIYVCFVDRCFSFCIFSFGHCSVCSSIYGFWLPIW